MRIDDKAITLIDEYSRRITLQQGVLYSFISIRRTASDQITAIVHNGKLDSWDLEANTITTKYERPGKKTIYIPINLNNITVICKIKIPLEEIGKMPKHLDMLIKQAYIDELYTPMSHTESGGLFNMFWSEILEAWKPLTFQTIKIKDAVKI